MWALTELASVGLAGLAAAGVTQAGAGVALLRAKRQEPVAVPQAWPAVSVLKPLYGDEALLEPALASFCLQDYPRFQIVFGVQSPLDPAIAVVRRLQSRFPHLDLELVIDSRRHGRNNKVGNLLNMFGRARHDIVVIADSDIHAPPGMLSALVATLQRPGVGLATTLYAGLPLSRTLTGALGAAYINHTFLPGALMARGLGRQDCLGAIMALERRTLERIGGLSALADHLADDALLGQLVRRAGLAVELARLIPETTVPETRLPALVKHELRWMRTVKSVAPVGFVLGGLQFPLFWATLMVIAGSDHLWVWVAFAAAWAARAGFAALSDRLLGSSSRLPFWCLPFRDVLSVTIMLASYRSNRVAWRGQEYRVTSFSDAVLQPGKG